MGMYRGDVSRGHGVGRRLVCDSRWEKCNESPTLLNVNVRDEVESGDAIKNRRLRSQMSSVCAVRMGFLLDKDGDDTWD